MTIAALAFFAGLVIGIIIILLTIVVAGIISASKAPYEHREAE